MSNLFHDSIIGKLQVSRSFGIAHFCQNQEVVIVNFLVFACCFLMFSEERESLFRYFERFIKIAQAETCTSHVAEVFDKLGFEAETQANLIRALEMLFGLPKKVFFER